MWYCVHAVQLYVKDTLTIALRDANAQSALYGRSHNKRLLVKMQLGFDHPEESLLHKGTTDVVKRTHVLCGEAGGLVVGSQYHVHVLCSSLWGGKTSANKRKSNKSWKKKIM